MARTTEPAQLEQLRGGYPLTQQGIKNAVEVNWQVMGSGMPGLLRDDLPGVLTHMFGCNMPQVIQGYPGGASAIQGLIPSSFPATMQGVQGVLVNNVLPGLQSYWRPC